jgi:hypothetical protein
MYGPATLRFRGGSQHEEKKNCDNGDETTH